MIAQNYRLAAMLSAVLLALAGCAQMPASPTAVNPALDGAAPTGRTLTEAALVGAWVQEIPGQPGKQQGWRLHADGSADSINSATYVVKAWRLEGDDLVLIGESVGNGGTYPFEDRLEVVRALEDELVVKRGSLELIYHAARP